MKKGGNSNIERKLADLHYPFSEDSWDKMEMLLNEEEDKLTGGLPAPQDTNTIHGIFRSIGVIVVFVVATVGATYPTKLTNSLLKNTPNIVIDTQTEEREQIPPADNKSIKVENNIIKLHTAAVSRKKESRTVTPNIPIRKHLLMQEPTIRLKRPVQISKLTIKKPNINKEPKLAELSKIKVPTTWHYDLQFGYERLPKSFFLLNNFNNRYYAGINMSKDLNKKLAINFNYTFSIYNKGFRNDINLIGLSEEEVNINIDTNTVQVYSNNIAIESSFRNLTQTSVFSNSVGLSTIFQVKKWNFESGIFFEHLLPQHGLRGNNWGVHTGVSRDISKRIGLTITGRYGSARPALDPKSFNNYSLGFGLKYKLK
jgi:hypothetical protein